MQIKGLHKNVYRLYRYARTQELLEVYRTHHSDRVLKWRKLKEEGVSDQTTQEFVGISRATYYRSYQRLKDLERNLQPPSKRPKG